MSKTDRLEEIEALLETPFVCSNKPTNACRLHQYHLRWTVDEIKRLRKDRMSPVDFIYKPEFPEDTSKLRELMPELSMFADGVIDIMWAAWSEWFYCAGWISVDPWRVERFRHWLRGEP